MVLFINMVGSQKPGPVAGKEGIPAKLVFAFDPHPYYKHPMKDSSTLY